jgi:hypothetical protein
MNTVGREEFEARIEAVEARMDARVAATLARVDALAIRMDERDRRLDERDKRLDERDKRFELLVQRVTAMADSASNLKTHMWLAAATLSLGAIGTVVAAYYATQASHLGMAQTIISAFQQGQQAQIPLKQ